MNCCQCQGIETIFDDRNAWRELKDYHKNGAKKTTQLLSDALKRQGVGGYSLIDVGGGIGALQYALLDGGVSEVISADASTAYLKVSQHEAEALGVADQIAYRHGNFVEIAPELAQADVVTLDRVICCFDDMPALVSASVGLAKKFYGVVFPVDEWWAKFGVGVMNAFFWLTRNPFRVFVHPTEKIEALVTEHGFERIFYERKGFWQVIVFAN